MRLCLMVEGQEGVSWAQWLALAEAVEAAGLEGLFRSDHYASVFGQLDRGSLDAWATLAAIAARTERIRLGTMVSPATFRHPSELARAAATVDHVSGGRVELGLGAGWYEHEHRAHGFPFPPTRVRLELFAEQLELVHRQWTEDAFDFEGRHYRLEGCRALPKPLQRPRPPLIVGGQARPGTVEPAVRFADEYNTFPSTVDEVAARREILVDACERAGRDPATLALSVMVPVVVADDEATLLARARAVLAVMGRDDDPAAFLDEMRPTWLVGTPEQAIERLRELERAGVERVLLQHLAHEDLETVALVGERLVPALAG